MVVFYERFLKSFEWHSSPIDWCEPNYAISSSIAEFYNTVSNGIFVVLPSFLIYLFHPFARGHSWRIQLIWLLTVVIGLSSAYFHATLSLSGQLLDEFGILWVCGVGLAFWMPKAYLPRFIGKREDYFEKVMLAGTLAGTVLGCFWPYINAFVLMSISLPFAVLIILEIRRCQDRMARYVAGKAIVLWLIAVTVWLSDRFACAAWRMAMLPGGHWLWHLLVCLCAYQATVFVVFNDTTVSGCCSARPIIRLWPSESWRILGIAYIELRTPLPELNGNCDAARCKNC